VPGSLSWTDEPVQLALDPSSAEAQEILREAYRKAGQQAARKGIFGRLLPWAVANPGVAAGAAAYFRRS
jgi:hypothetical protein